MLKRISGLFIFLLITTGCDGFFFYPSKAVIYQPDICSAQPENYFVETADNFTLHAWLFRTKDPRPKGTVVFMHGNANNVSSETLGMLWLTDKGYNLFTFDYRGYGVSTGRPSIKGVLQDGVDIIDGFMQIKDIDKDDLILYGQSLGGAVAAYAAAYSQYADRFSILVLDSAFTSWRDMAREAAGNIFITWPFQYPISWAYPDDMSPKELLPLSKIKYTLIIHSKADKLVNFRNGEKLFQLSQEPKEIIIDVDAAHAQILSQPVSRKKLLDFFSRVLDSGNE